MSKETEGLLAGSVEQAYLENRSAGGKRRTEALGALQAMYVFQFCGSLAYGMWAVISPYFLEARGFETELLHYCTPDLTPENALLLARRRPDGGPA